VIVGDVRLNIQVGGKGFDHFSGGPIQRASKKQRFEPIETQYFLPMESWTVAPVAKVRVVLLK
jgi:hypothetical protein